MKSPDRPYEGHLTLRELSIPAGGVWSSFSNGWSVIRVARGAGYYIGQRLNQELQPGSVALLPPGVNGSVRASQLGELSSTVFSVLPARLTGLASLTEQRQLEQAAAAPGHAVRIFAPTCPATAGMEALLAGPGPGGLRLRLKLLQIFVELASPELEQAMPAEDSSDAKQRLQLILQQAPSAELLEMNFNELAQQTHCTSRHLGRIFQELMGMSFRDKRAEIRLEKARELLATTDCKIVEVAMESGFKSLSLFNLMFARRFGMSPGKWRQKQGIPRGIAAPQRARSFSLASHVLAGSRVNVLARSRKSDGIN